MKLPSPYPLLVLLWSYAAISKFLDFRNTKADMLNQVFPQYIAETLAWAVPIIEILVTALLIFSKTRLVGLYSSFTLLLGFTTYITLIIANTFGRIPCSCGGILEKMSWNQHLLFNLLFIAVTILSIILDHKQTRLKTIRKIIRTHKETRGLYRR